MSARATVYLPSCVTKSGNRTFSIPSDSAKGVLDLLRRFIIRFATVLESGSEALPFLSILPSMARCSINARIVDSRRTILK